MKTADEWVKEIDFEIERLKLNGRHTYYQFSIGMTKEIATEIQKYFKDKYTTEFRKCNRCVNKYDFIIDF